MYSCKTAAQMQQQAADLKLKYPAIFVEMSSRKLAAVANGYGSERWPEELRNVVTWIFRHYPLAAAIHDVRYEFSDGSELTRRAADAEFAANLYILWRLRYGSCRWLNIFAVYGRIKIAFAVHLTRAFGRSAWLDAWKKQMKKRRKKDE